MKNKTLATINADVMMLKRHRAYEEADAAAFDALKRFFFQGREVYWKHGARTRSGRVVIVLGFCYASASVRVEGNSGKVYSLPASTLVMELQSSGRNGARRRFGRRCSGTSQSQRRESL